MALSVISISKSNRSRFLLVIISLAHAVKLSSINSFTEVLIEHFKSIPLLFQLFICVVALSKQYLAFLLLNPISFPIELRLLARYSYLRFFSLFPRLQHPKIYF